MFLFVSLCSGPSAPPLGSPPSYQPPSASFLQATGQQPNPPVGMRGTSSASSPSLTPQGTTGTPASGPPVNRVEHVPPHVAGAGMGRALGMSDPSQAPSYPARSQGWWNISSETTYHPTSLIYFSPSPSLFTPPPFPLLLSSINPPLPPSSDS